MGRFPRRCRRGPRFTSSFWMRARELPPPSLSPSGSCRFWSREGHRRARHDNASESTKPRPPIIGAESTAPADFRSRCCWVAMLKRSWTVGGGNWIQAGDAGFEPTTFGLRGHVSIMIISGSTCAYSGPLPCCDNIAATVAAGRRATAALSASRVDLGISCPLRCLRSRCSLDQRKAGPEPAHATAGLWLGECQKLLAAKGPGVEIDVHQQTSPQALLAARKERQWNKIVWQVRKENGLRAERANPSGCGSHRGQRS